MQSEREVTKVFKALGVPEKVIDKEKLKEIFDCRNSIIHELDIDLEKPGRKRIHRGMEEMVAFTDHLLFLAEHLIQVVDEMLSTYEAWKASNLPTHQLS